MARVMVASDDVLWNAVVGRDRRFDGVVYYGVHTTGIYCRPACPSRRPRREHVVFFTDPTDARRAGYRACRRCRPDKPLAPDANRALVGAAARLFEQHDGSAAPLAAVAKRIGLSPRRTREVFDEVLGISPGRLLDAMRFVRFRRALAREGSVTKAVYAAGYASPSRVYDGVSRRLGMTPVEYRNGAQGRTIYYEIAESALGRLLVAGTEQGVCRVSIGGARRELLQGLREEFPRATLEPATPAIVAWTRALLGYLEGKAGWPSLPLDVYATAFQAKVWAVLRSIPEGRTLTYGEIARRLGLPKAARAVARACASNAVALAIPCHRVVPGAGGAGGYRWGAERKQTLLGLEQRNTRSARRTRSQPKGDGVRKKPARNED